MEKFAKAALGAFMLAAGVFAFAAPASAQVGISFGFGDGFAVFDSCDYYDYYDQAPPWGLPDDYCDYPLYFEPVFFDGLWYRGPIFYRWTHGHRVFWLNGGWREDGRRGAPPPAIAWENRGGPLRGFRPGVDFHGGMAPYPRGGPWFGGRGEAPGRGDFGGPGGHGGGPGHH
jgi:hypothetical protein